VKIFPPDFLSYTKHNFEARSDFGEKLSKRGGL